MAKYTKSALTKKYSRLALVFTILSLLLLFGPLGYYAIAGFAGGALLVEKIALGSTLIIALVITFICMINRFVFKSKMWLIIIGLFLVTEHLLPMIVVFAVTQVLDELVVAPLARRYRNKASNCKDTDKQLAERNL